jgi:hypothetical protein
MLEEIVDHVDVHVVAVVRGHPTANSKFTVQTLTIRGDVEILHLASGACCPLRLTL